MANKITDRAIEHCRKRFKKGEANALLDAIAYCALSGTVMPPWIIDAYCARYDAWNAYSVKTLDEAFGVERKNSKIPNLQKLKSRHAVVAREVSRLRRAENLPIDVGLFERVGEILNIPPGRVNKIYYDKTNPWREFFEGVYRLRMPK